MPRFLEPVRARFLRRIGAALMQVERGFEIAIAGANLINAHLAISFKPDGSPVASFNRTTVAALLHSPLQWAAAFGVLGVSMGLLWWNSLDCTPNCHITGRLRCLLWARFSAVLSTSFVYGCAALAARTDATTNPAVAERLIYSCALCVVCAGVLARKAVSR